MNIPTAEELAAMLDRVNVEDVAREAGLSAKTIYRFRWMTSSPRLATLRLLIPAIEKVRAEAARAAKAEKRATTEAGA